MRLLLASIYAIGFFYVCVAVLFGLFGQDLPIFVMMSLVIPIWCIAIFSAYVLFNRPEERWPAPTIEELEQRGLVISTDFRARRAIQVQEFDDEGLHYYLELEDGSVLFLSGQYLYDYEPIKDEPELNQKRTFPNTDFTIKRHRTQGHVWQIVTRGTPFEPEAIAPPFPNMDYWSGVISKDGDIWRDKSFDEIKSERLKHAS